MIWNSEILFIHVPKTAGMSLTTLLTKGLKGRVFYTEPGGARKADGDLVRVPGHRHETMAMAATALEAYNRPLSSFKRVFAVMREPYTLEISRYNYLRIDNPWDGGPAKNLALEGNFKEYLRRAPFNGYFPPRLDLYYHVFNSLPPNLTVLSFEHLNDDIKTHVAPYLNEGELDLPHENATGDSKFDKYYDAESEALCYERHRWFFDKGFYRRRRAATSSSTSSA